MRKSPDRPIWPLLSAVTLAAAIISYIRSTGAAPVGMEVALFAVRWLGIAAFALLGRLLFRSQC